MFESTVECLDLMNAEEKFRMPKKVDLELSLPRLSNNAL